MKAATVAMAPSGVIRIILVAISFLVFAHLGVCLIRNVGGYPTVYGLVPLFDLNSEQSIPTYFSATLHLLSSGLVATVAVMKKREGAAYARHWILLSATFAYMAFDEAAGLHDLVERPMEELMGANATGLLHFAWVVPGIVIVVIVALSFLTFFLHLPARTRLLVLGAASLFLSGAIGVEIFEGRHAAMHGSSNLAFDLIVMLEETLEMLGITVFVYAMLTYIEQHFGEVRIQLTSSGDTHE